MDSMHLDSTSSSPHAAPVNGHDASLAEGGSPSLPTASPTGGRVDEVGDVHDIMLLQLADSMKLDPLPPSLASDPQPTG